MNVGPHNRVGRGESIVLHFGESDQRLQAV